MLAATEFNKPRLPFPVAAQERILYTEGAEDDPATPRCRGVFPYRVAEMSLSYAFPLTSIREHPMSAALVGSELLWGQGITSMDRLEVGQHRSGLAHGQAGCPPSP